MEKRPSASKSIGEPTRQQAPRPVTRPQDAIRGSAVRATPAKVQRGMATGTSTTTSTTAVPGITATIKSVQPMGPKRLANERQMKKEREQKEGKRNYVMKLSNLGKW